MNRYLSVATMRLGIMLFGLVLLGIVGCRSGSGSTEYELYRPPPATQVRDEAAARALHERALRELESGDLPSAEATLRKALSEDVMLGPAHNTLGVLYFDQQRFYEAAWEFQYAARLMPKQPEPLNNLGLVFERVGKLDDAVTSYGRAVDLQPANPQFLGNLARARHRRGEEATELQPLLHRLIRHEHRPEWIAWANDLLKQSHSDEGPDL